MEAFALNVGSVVASNMGSFVKGNAGPLKRCGLLFNRALHKPGPVSIFHTEDAHATGMPGKQVVVQCGAKRADMKETGR